jgi:N-acetylglucosamine-6-phosphate deacetylase
MRPFGHREPGLAGAVLETDAIAAEIVCDGVHVHPAAVRAAVAAKGVSKIMAITDGTAASGIPRGGAATLGGRRITARDAAYLDDGTLAGSVLTMDRAFRTLVKAMGFSLIEAAHMCATTPARELALAGLGVIAPGATADLVVLDSDLNVVETYIGGVGVIGIPLPPSA